MMEVEQQPNKSRSKKREREVVNDEVVGEEEEESIDSKIDQVVLPGDLVGRITDLKIRLGPGLIQHQDYIVATKSGFFRNPIPKYYWIENVQKRYVPALEDMVIGIITDRHVDYWKVDIGAAQLATLSAFAFEGATKKNRPNLQVGSLVYARVILANKDMEPEIACLSARNKSEGYGELSEGFLFKTTLSLASQLLDDNNRVLELLGSLLPFEIAVGMNGRVWVKAENPLNCIMITNAILNSEFLPNNQLKAMISKLQAHFSAMER